ncbi:MAG: class I SAM-dependent methyltransferase [Candidatus Moranbacteria bacterium]|nr:class I SAM-dependent methyltransferase [Candidatus Moranbacteria bacterium]
MFLMNISDLTTRLVLENDIWNARSSGKINFPEDSYNQCFEVEDKSFWFKHRNDCIVSVVKHFHSGTFILDIGGGNGFVSYALQQKGIKTYMMEPGQDGIMNAKKRGVKNLIMSTLETAGFRHSTIPSIGIFDVLEHIEDDRGFLQNIKNHLTPGGKLFITVPAFQALWSENDEYAGHMRRYSVPQLEELLVKTGFEINYSSYFFSVMLPFIFLCRKRAGIAGGKKKIKKVSEAAKNSLRMPFLLSPFFNCIWKLELFMVKRKMKIPAGSSIIIVAERSKYCQSCCLH